MALNLPPDPYKVLGVSKDAKLAEIRSSHRKLVLKCHPDKVQDAALKAVKQDEFQKVQQAYELLSDDNKRIQYDEQMKVFKLRAELGRGSAGGPSIRTGASPFDYEIKIAEPGPTTYSRTTSTSAHAPYSSYPPSKSYEEVYDVKYRTAKKSASYESTEKRRLSTRDGDRERIYRSDERERERDREKYEKESSKAAHADKKKTKDREKRRGTEEKTRSRTAYVEDESDNYRQQPPKKEKSERRRVEEELPIQYKREREEKPKDSSHAKMENRKEFAFQYMQAARQKLKGATGIRTDFVDPPPMARSATFSAPERERSYSVHNVSPTHASPKVQTYHFDEDDSPRRSSARSSRRTSETPEYKSSREAAEYRTSKEPSRREASRRSPATSRTREGITIVEPPSPQSPSMSPISIMRSPKLPTHTSAPGGLASMVRDKPSRSQTQDYSRPQERSTLPLPRAQTFQAGDRDHLRTGGSRLRKTVDYGSEDDSNSSSYTRSPRHSSSPPPRRDDRKATKTKYFINENNKATPVTGHRPDLRDIDDEYVRSPRDRSESPRSNRRSERPPLVACGSYSSRQAPQRSPSKSYYPEGEPVIRDARPSMPDRGAPHVSSQRSSPISPAGLYGEIPTKGHFSEVKYSPSLKAENIQYSPHSSPYSSPTDGYRRGSAHDYPHRPYEYRSSHGQVHA